MDKSTLIKKALIAREHSYSPYSGYAVGAAILASTGNIYTGCNIENASYSGTVCAERTALFKGVSEGEKEFVAIAIVAGKSGFPISERTSPCGICRQVLREFSDPDKFIVITAIDENNYDEYTLSELLPNSFGPEFIG